MTLGKRSLALGAFLALTLSRPAPSQTGSPSSAPPLAAYDLRCDAAVDPLGVDSKPPRLSWKVRGEGRGRRQTAYRVLAASSAAGLTAEKADLWDSGRVSSDKTLGLAYGGRSLSSFERVHWQVRVWDENEASSDWSPAAEWTMGVLDPADWKARWIGASDAAGPAADSILLRRELAVKPGLVRALAFACGLGVYEMSLNGRRVGRDLLTPGWTKYDKTCLYDTYDVTGLLSPGRNAAVLLLANGFYNVRGGRYTKYTGSFGPIRAIALLRLEYADGSVELCGTDGAWKAGPSPLTFSCMYGGEDFDARLAWPGVDGAGFDDAAWKPAGLLPGPGGVLRGTSAAAPPIRVIETLRPASIRALGPGLEIYDLGQNAPVMLRLAVRGPAGSSVRVTPAELLNTDGTLDRRSSGGGECWWQYTLAGGAPETYEAKFFYHGSRYLQAERRPAAPGGPLPEIEALEGLVVHTSSAPSGDFACSNDLFNRIRTLIRWAQRANLVSLITDCPHRERLGWLEQYHLNGPSLRYEWDLGRLFAKGLTDMADSQLENGLVPDIAPEYTVFSGGFRDSPEWGSAFILVPWQQYLWTGDLEPFRRHFEEMKRYVEYLASKADGHILSHGLGDWYDIGPQPPGYAQLTPISLTATAFYYEDVCVLSAAAGIMGRNEDADLYMRRAAAIREAFNRKFLDARTGLYATGAQAAQAIPLVMGLVPEGSRDAAVEALVKDVQAHGNALTTGDVGFRYLLRALADAGRSDVIFEMNAQSDKPGYGYQLKKGATSLTEAWDAGPTSSQNHFMLGHIMEWFYSDLAGIKTTADGPGFKEIIIRPSPTGDLTWARGSLETVRGRIESEWRIEGGKLRLTVDVPANTTARIFMPGGPGAEVREGGRPAGAAAGVKAAGTQGGRAVFEVGSGRFEFELIWN
jgi:alpha-L-rhamnosidase